MLPNGAGPEWEDGQLSKARFWLLQLPWNVYGKEGTCLCLLITGKLLHPDASGNRRIREASGFPMPEKGVREMSFNKSFIFDKIFLSVFCQYK